MLWVLYQFLQLFSSLLARQFTARIRHLCLTFDPTIVATTAEPYFIHL